MLPIVLAAVLAGSPAAGERLTAPPGPAGSAEDLRYRAEGFYLDGDLEAAAELYLAAAERTSDPALRARALLAAAWLEHLLERHSAAAAHLGDALALDSALPFDPRLYTPEFERLYLDLRRRASGAPPPAALGRPPAAPSALYNRALDDLDAGRHDEALERLQRVASQTFGRDGDARELRRKALAGIGWLYFQRRQLDDAATVLESALELDRRDLAVWRDLALVRLRSGDPAGAVAALSEAYALEPGDVEIARLLARTLVGAEEWEEAVSWTSDAIRHHPADAELRLRLGLALAGRGSDDTAAAALSEAMRLDSSGEWSSGRLAALHLGRHHYRAGRYDDAVAAARRGLERRPDDAELWNLLGLGAQAAGDVTTAQRAFEAACEHDGGRSDYADNLGRAHVAAGELAAAEDAFVRALTLDPDFAAARAGLLRVRELRSAERSSGR